jgi:peroxiredoxin family protein
MRLLRIQNKQFLQQDYVAKLIRPYIEKKGNKKRLIEAPDVEIKKIQKRIKTILSKLDYPAYVFSGVKGRTILDNAKLHPGNLYLYKIDLTAFFPSITREKVFAFFKNKFDMPVDVAEILANITTIDIEKTMAENIDEIYDFLNEKKIKTKSHLISGSPTSQLLSYLANQDLFDALHDLSVKNGVVMSIYVDDIVFSSSNRISQHFKEIVKNIIGSYFYRISSKKEKMHTKYYSKKVTGVVINKHGELTIPNSLRLKTIRCFEALKSNPNDEKCRRSLRGLVQSARQITPNVFPSIYTFAYDPNYKLTPPARKRRNGVKCGDELLTGKNVAPTQHRYHSYHRYH